MRGVDKLSISWRKVGIFCLKAVENNYINISVMIWKFKLNAEDDGFGIKNSNRGKIMNRRINMKEGSFEQDNERKKGRIY